MEASTLLNIELKAVVIKMLTELSANYNGMKREIKAINKSQTEKKNDISDMKNTMEGISRLDEAEDWITDLEEKVEIKTQLEHQFEQVI